MGRGRILVLLALLVFSTAAPPARCAGQPNAQITPSLIIDNGLVELKKPLLFESGRVLLSLPDLIGLFPIDCEKQGDTGIVLKGGGITLTMLLDKKLAVVAKEGGLEAVRLDVPPKLQSSVLYLPLRFIAEAFSAQVLWDKQSGYVLISTARQTQKEDKNVEYTILSRQDLQANGELSAWYEKHHRTPGLYSLTLAGDTYVLLCAGMRPTGGYAVRIEGAEEEGENGLFIRASLSKPGPTDIVTMALTYPNTLLKFASRSFETINSSLAE